MPSWPLCFSINRSPSTRLPVYTITYGSRASHFSVADRPLPGGSTAAPHLRAPLPRAARRLPRRRSAVRNRVRAGRVPARERAAAARWRCGVRGVDPEHARLARRAVQHSDGGERRFVLVDWVGSDRPYRLAHVEEFDDEPVEASEAVTLAGDVRDGFTQLT